MAMAARYTYRQAALLALVWLIVTVLLVLIGAWLNRRFDTAGQWRVALSWAVVGVLALLPLLAGAVHRSVRLVTCTALFEVVSLGFLMVLLTH